MGPTFRGIRQEGYVLINAISEGGWLLAAKKQTYFDTLWRREVTENRYSRVESFHVSRAADSAVLGVKYISIVMATHKKHEFGERGQISSLSRGKKNNEYLRTFSVCRWNLIPVSKCWKLRSFPVFGVNLWWRKLYVHSAGTDRWTCLAQSANPSAWRSSVALPGLSRTKLVRESTWLYSKRCLPKDKYWNKGKRFKLSLQHTQDINKINILRHPGLDEKRRSRERTERKDSVAYCFWQGKVSNRQAGSQWWCGPRDDNAAKQGNLKECSSNERVGRARETTLDGEGQPVEGWDLFHAMNFRNIPNDEWHCHSSQVIAHGGMELCVRIYVEHIRSRCCDLVRLVLRIDEINCRLWFIESGFQPQIITQNSLACISSGVLF